jgi:hypothetical protein
VIGSEKYEGNDRPKIKNLLPPATEAEKAAEKPATKVKPATKPAKEAAPSEAKKGSPF